MIQRIQKKAVMDMTKKKRPDTKGGDVTDSPPVLQASLFHEAVSS